MLEIRKGPRQRTWKLRRKRLKRPPDGARAGKRLALNGTLTNLEALAGLARIGATIDEAAVFFEVSQPTVNARFRSFPALRLAWDQGRADSTVSLRRILFDKAKRPNQGGAQVAMYLAKQLLTWGDGIIDKPAARVDPLQNLSPADRALFIEIMAKLGVDVASNNGGEP